MHRAAGATEVLIVVGQSLRADARAARRAGAGAAALLAKLSPVDLVLVEGFKRDPHPKLEVHRAANGKPLLASRRSAHRRRSRRDAPLPQARVPVVSLDDIDAIADILVAARGAAPMPSLAQRAEPPDGAAHRRLLRVLRPAAADRRDGAADRRARHAGRRDRARAARATRTGACWRAT